MVVSRTKARGRAPQPCSWRFLTNLRQLSRPFDTVIGSLKGELLEEIETFVTDDRESNAQHFERLAEQDAARKQLAKELRALGEKFDTQVKSLEQLSLTFENAIKEYEGSETEWARGWEFREAQSTLALLHLGLMWLVRPTHNEEPGINRLERAARLSFEVALGSNGFDEFGFNPRAQLNEILELLQRPKRF